MQTFKIETNTLPSLRKFIKDNYPQYSSRQIESLLVNNGCYLNERIERFGSRKLKPHDSVKIDQNVLNLNSSKDIKIPILYEDDGLLIINKPINITSSKKELGTHLKREIYLVHRLDKMTSGVLILAKNEEMQKSIENLFFKKEVFKQYLAIVDGRFIKNKGVIEKDIRLKKRYEGGVEYQVWSKGVQAKTKWQKSDQTAQEALLILHPITGRTHQLRVHLSAIGHPILGDPVYGKLYQSSIKPSRLLLHAHKISFIHPKERKKIEIFAPIPIILKQIIKKHFKKSKLCAY